MRCAGPDYLRDERDSPSRREHNAAWKARYRSKVSEQHGDPRFFEMNERIYDGLRNAGTPEA
jgi:hypothetical protein